jgi:hypothetical protein
MYVLLYLHILTMFTAVSLAAGASILMLIAARRGDRAVVAGLAGLPIARTVPALYVVGGLFGLGTALTFGYNLLAPWLVIAYLVFAFLAGLGIAYSGPLMARVHAIASDRGADGTAFADVMRRFQLDAALSLGGIAVIVADMVFKPFS